MKNKILIVEHNLTDFELIQDELKKGCVNYIAKMVQTENEYEKALHNFKPDIILSNYTFPYFDGATAFKLKKKLAPKTPFIFVTESIGEEKAIELIKNGVTDFALKERLGTLSAKINRALEENTEPEKRLIDVKKIMDSSLDVICTSDEQGKFVHISAASESLWGYKPEELIGTDYMDLIFHGDIENTINADANVKSGVSGTMFENRYIHKDGSIVPLLWSAKWDDKDKLMYCIAKDPSKVIKLEKAFKIERQRFHDLYLHAPSCMGILKGPNHIFEMANPLYLQLIDKKDVVGKTVKEVLPELESQGIFAFLDTVYQTGETFSANEMLVKFDYHGNGKLVDTYLNFIYQAHRDTDNNINGILFFANDVTEQVLSRKKIEESVLRYNSLIEQAGDAICFIDASMQIIEVNHYACEKLGYSKAEISQLSIADFFLEEDLKVSPMQMDALKEGNTVRNERRIKRKNDTLIDVELSAKMMKDGSFLIFLRDITEHKKAQQALIENEKKYRQIVETAQEGIWLVNENQTTTFVNNKMGEILEYTQEEMIGKDIYFFMDDKGKQFVEKLLLRKEEKYSRQSRFKYISKSGKEVWTHISVNPLFDDAGIYQGSLAMVTDITESIKAEKNLEQQNKELAFQDEEKENRAAELLIANKELAFQNKEKENRANELIIANKELAFQNSEKENRANELIIANKELEFQSTEKEDRANELIIANKELAFQNSEKEDRANELIIAYNELIKTNIELDRFVYSVSHDLRSPLTSILGLISFIEEESKETDTLEHVRMIRSSVNRLDEFIKNILSYSRNNRTGLEVEKIPLQKTTIDIVASLHSMKDAKGIHFEIDIRKQSPFYSDSLRFKTILENIISNAIKHHKKDISDRYIKITGQSDPEKLELTISDNGIGIAPAYHQKIFDMFFRLSGKTDGSGIGLYIVKDTVEILQGTIKIHSEEGVGTVFIVTLKNLKP